MKEYLMMPHTLECLHCRKIVRDEPNPPLKVCQVYPQGIPQQYLTFGETTCPDFDRMTEDEEWEIKMRLNPEWTKLLLDFRDSIKTQE